MAPACGRRSALAERRGRKWRRWRPGRRRRAATARARTPSVRAGASPRASTPKWRCWPSTCSSRCPRTGRSRPGPSWRRWPTYRPSSVSPARRQPFPPAQISLLLLSPQTNPITPSHPSPPTIPYYCTTDMLHQPPAPRNAFILGFIFFVPFRLVLNSPPPLKRINPALPSPASPDPRSKITATSKGLKMGLQNSRTIFRGSHEKVFLRLGKGSGEGKWVGCGGDVSGRVLSSNPSLPLA